MPDNVLEPLTPAPVTTPERPFRCLVCGKTPCAKSDVAPRVRLCEEHERQRRECAAVDARKRSNAAAFAKRSVTSRETPARKMGLWIGHRWV